ncbi:Rrf2 family transcriptional regulator [Flavobacterium sp. MAH-1]|uniref:Rrf2 family transcriptional regulator n=1 Tax=Flavobacterium agri TaxID=2743471 RepID=A0A7Y8Y2A3_9FLAO|nr:Rrf2 family transcriptional regulator [Flavobacterium agri]NUY81083.1 Rrf2 family transcriptional regulator [Flavobacterium agri]NYA71107.1 Rrf2 family transcriptional regulator [Flavobacterium agri]
MISGKFAITLHILTLLSKHKDEFLSSEFIANSLNMNPVLVRKEIANLKKNDVVESREGKNGGTRLLRAADTITLDDIFKITFDHVTLGYSKNEPNQECPVGKSINQNLQNLYDDLNNNISKQLSEVSLLNFSDTF